MAWLILGQIACSDYALSAKTTSWTDTFEIEQGGQRSDVLFYVDQSLSMFEELRTLGERIRQFTDRLAESSDDWHLAAVTDDHPCAITGILDDATPNFDQRFNDAVVQGGGNPMEHGISTILDALKHTAAGQCNEGFLRPDSILQILFISDEPDSSLGSPWLEVYDGHLQHAPATTDYWKDYLRAYTAYHSPESIRVSGVTGPYGGCMSVDDNGMAQSAWEGAGYLETIGWTGGQAISICSDWGPSIDVLANETVLAKRFSLSEVPVPETIVVRVDDENFTDWTYDEPDNDVVFATPARGGSVVEISYDLLNP